MAGRSSCSASKADSIRALCHGASLLSRRNAGRCHQPHSQEATTVPNGGCEAFEYQSAEDFGINNYRLDGFSVERLMNFLTALDRDIEIIIRKKPPSRRTAKILVTAA